MSSQKRVPAPRTTLKRKCRSQKAVAKTNAELHSRPTSQDENAIVVHRRRDQYDVSQMLAATSVPHGIDASEEWIAPGCAALYLDFGATDPVDSILAKLMVGISN